MFISQNAQKCQHYSQNTKKHLMWAVSLLLYAHFIKPRCNVWYCNTQRYFDLITAAAEKPALHKYDLAKGVKK